ncbi:MAG: ATP-binding protein [Lentisphaeria bacterium]|nr:ATP-binding protein [Lentisphaeria bacterium]
MNHYTERKTHWRESKALEFFLNFIRNHDGSVNDNDTFELVAGLRTHEQWIELVKQTFPAEMIEKMEQQPSRGDSLDFTDEPKEMIREIWCCDHARKKARSMLSEVAEEELRKHPAENYAEETFAQKVSELQNTMKLNNLEVRILLVFAFVENRLLCIGEGHKHRSDENDKAVFAAKSLDCELSEVMEVLDNKGKLRRYRCVDSDLDFNGGLLRFLNGFTHEPLTSMFYTISKEETLPWDFYGSLAEKHGELIERIISCCDGTNSANILLYGAPGTGKTSFAKTLADRLHRTCYMIRQSDNDRDSRNDSEFRFGALEVCAERVDPEHSLIVIDESDDMLRGGSSSFFSMLFGGNLPVGDKGRLNSVLDAVKVPTIWITNTPAGALDESSRRRFDYSIRFDPLTDSQRKMIWRNNVAKMQLETLVSDAMQTKFASVYPVSAGGITMVLQNVAKLKPKTEDVENLVDRLMKPHCELLGLSAQRNKMLPAKDYSLEGVNIKGKIPLAQIVEAIRNYQSGSTEEIDRPRMNLLLSGAPGTGKTEFVKYIGAELNTKVIVKMGSDLLNMYVGGTEQLIKQAFEEAEQEHAILFLDEIDGMLQSRGRSQHTWEVTQVNELLHQMENFNGIMIGATNFASNLDPAVMRRFTFKLEFDYLDEAGKKIFFERMFRSQLSAEEEKRLAAIPRLAPGDFRTVRQSLFYLGGSISNDDRIDALQKESESKHDLQPSDEKKRIGF